MVYTLLSGPMVYTLFHCFPRKMVYTIVFLLCDPGVGRQTEKRGVPRWRCILFFPPQGSRGFGAREGPSEFYLSFQQFGVSDTPPRAP